MNPQNQVENLLFSFDDVSKLYLMLFCLNIDYRIVITTTVCCRLKYQKFPFISVELFWGWGGGLYLKKVWLEYIYSQIWIKHRFMKKTNGPKITISSPFYRITRDLFFMLKVMDYVFVGAILD